MRRLGKRKDKAATEQTKAHIAELYLHLREGQLAVDLSLSLMRFKIKQLKKTASELNLRFDEVLSALNTELK